MTMSRSNDGWLAIAATIGGCAIALGAVGAHGIGDPASQLLAEKSSYFQLIHALLLAFLASRHGNMFTVARCLCLVGIILFCGSLYAKAFMLTAEATLAPIGGICLMLAWLTLAIGAVRRQ